MASDAPSGHCANCLIQLGLAGAASTEAGTVSPELIHAPPFANPRSPALPLFGDYELLSEIAQGGMGVVYKARQLSLNRTVAVKMIRSGAFASKEFVHRFRVEASAAAVLQHPNIVAVHEVGVHEGQHFFSMDYVAGKNLAQVASDGPLPANRAARYVQKIAEAIHYAHQSGILHRDLKPSNVLIDQNDQPRITDFGLAKQLNSESSATLTGDVMGTPGYMPPEQASGNRGAVKAWSDVYSIGAILYHLLTGRAPFAAGSLEETLNQMLHQDPISIRLLNPGVPRDLDTICLKCLEKEPPKRYGSAQLLAEELTRFLNKEPILARPISTADKAWRWCRRKPALATALGLVGIVTIGSPIAAVRINRERQRAEVSAASAQAAVTRLEIDRAEMLFEDNQSAEALAYLARVLRREPTNRVAGERVISALAHRNFCVPLFRLQHKDAIVAAEFSPDGQRIVTASKDGTARLWDGRSGQPLFGPWQHDGEATSARFSPDGKRVVTTSLDKTARAWDSNTGQALGEPLGHEAGVLCADFSPDGERLVTGSADGSMRVWNVAGRTPIGTPVKLGGGVDSVKFSPNGQQIVLASRPGRNGRIVNADTGKELAAFTQFQNLQLSMTVDFPSFSPDGSRVVTVPPYGSLSVIETASASSTNRTTAKLHSTSITCARFSPDGQYLATCAFDTGARVWDANRLQPVSEAMRHWNYVNSIEFSPDGQQVVTGSRDHTARVWHARTGQPLSEPLRHGANVLAAQFSSDGQRILSLCEGTAVWVWEVRLGQPLTASLQHPAEVRRAVFSPVSGRLATSTAGSLGLRLWDAQRATSMLPPFGLGAGDRDLQFSGDGRLLLAVGRPPSGSSNATVEIFDPDTGRSVAGPFRSPAPTLNDSQCGRFSPDGEFVLLGGYGHQVRVWHIATGKLVAELAHEAPPGYAQFSPDGQWVVTTSDDKTARLWRWPSGRPLLEPLRHGGAVVWADVSPDSRRLVTISRDQAARIWDARSGRTLHMLPHTEEPYDFNAVQFSSDGQLVVTASGRGAQVWDSHTGQPVTAPLKHDGRVNSVRFSPDGQRLVTACNDQTARVWDTATGHLLSEPLRHRDRVIYAEFSPDGRWVVTASTDGTARIWEVPRLSFSMPPWLADWAEAVGGQRLDARGAAQSVPVEQVSRVREGAQLGADGDETARWARWFFAAHNTRTTSPASPLSVPQLVERCNDTHTLQSLEQAVRMSPANGLAQARLALVRLTNGAGASPRLMADCDWQSRRALELSPTDPEVWWARAQLLEHVGKPTEALEAMDRASTLNPTNAAFWNAKGLLLEKANRWEAALQSYTKAIQFSGPWQDTLSYPAIALLNRSRLLQGMKRFAEATADNLAAAHAPDRDREAPPTLIDLSLFYTAGLDYNFGQTKGQNWLNAGLTPGRQTFQGTEFDLRGFIALRALSTPPRSAIVPERVSGIPIHQKCRRLYFLHAGAGHISPEGTRVGAYVLHHADGRSKDVPINYGEHLRLFDPDNDPRDALAHHSAVVWIGTNAARFPARLFRTTWTNPHPEVLVRTIDFTSNMAQFQLLLFAITAEP